MSWYSKEFGNVRDAQAPIRKVVAAFAVAPAASEDPGGPAVFSRFDAMTNVVTAYFSPAAASLARTMGALPCDRPSPTELALLAGAPHLLAQGLPADMPQPADEAGLRPTVAARPPTSVVESACRC